MLPWSFSEEAAVEESAPQLQHNLWVVAGRTAVLSVITGGGKWVEIEVPADPLYQHLIVTAERRSGVLSRAASPLPSLGSRRIASQAARRSGSGRRYE